MIVIEQENELLKAHVYGEMTLEDFTEFENAVADELKQFDHVNIVFDLSNMTGFSLDAALEELRFNKVHANDYRKIAVVTESSPGLAGPTPSAQAAARPISIIIPIWV